MGNFKNHRNGVFWLYGLSGAGKSTLAMAAAHAVNADGHRMVILDGDYLRSGLCHDLRFSPEDRLENVRRTAEVAKLLCRQGFIVLAALMTPHENMRQLARAIVGKEHFNEIYVKCDFVTCARRDTKGLYARAANGELSHFTGKDLVFEEPLTPDLVLDTTRQSVEECVHRLLKKVRSCVSVVVNVPSGRQN